MTANLRRYGSDLKLVGQAPAPDGKLPYGVAIDLAGRRVAVGYADATAVSILDAKTLSPLAKAQTGDLDKRRSVEASLGRATARRSSRAGGQTQLEDEWRRVLRRFDACRPAPWCRRSPQAVAQSSTLALRRRLRFRGR